MAISLVIFLLGPVAILAITHALSQQIAIIAFLFLYPTIAIISALPISIGGWGVREGVMIFVLGLLGIAPEQALAISIIYGFAGMIIALMMGLIGYGLLLPEWGTFFRPQQNQTEIA